MSYKFEFANAIRVNRHYSESDQRNDGAAPERPQSVESGTRAASRISVEIADAARLATIRHSWDELVAEAAEPNVFMDPALLRLADPSTRTETLLAWTAHDSRQRLVGVWAFAVGSPRKSPLKARVLNAPPCVHGYLATPVVDRAWIDETLEAMLDRLADNAHLPKIVALESMGADGAVMAALLRVLARRGSVPCILDRSHRPKLASDLDAKRYFENALSSGSRKKLRQHRRRLGEQGALTSVIIDAPEKVRHALEEFLALEAAGWKGQQGTALLCNRDDAAFMRAAVVALAEQGCASIHALYLDRRPVSMQIVVRSGRAVFTLKTAYDERFRDYSPGMLLLEDYTAAFLADDSIAFVDSCSHDDTGFMSAWTERQAVADLWFDVRHGGSRTFRFLSAVQQSYRDMRRLAKPTYHALRRLLARPKWAKLRRTAQ